MHEIVPVTATLPGAPMVPQAASDEQLLALWLHGRGPATRRAYESDARRLLAFTGCVLSQITLGHLQAFADSLATLAPASQHRTLAAVKSLFGFAVRLGYLRFDIGRPLRVAAVPNRLAERILAESEVHRMLAAERQPRNHALLVLLYASGIRVSECCGLKWRDVQARQDGGQITVLGKGNKTRAIRLPQSVWNCLMALRGNADDDGAVFRSRRGGHLHPVQVRRLVRAAARRAGLMKLPCPHSIRHSHASHALDNGAPISLVQTTLGHSSVATTGRYLHARPNESSSAFLPL